MDIKEELFWYVAGFSFVIIAALTMLYAVIVLEPEANKCPAARLPVHVQTQYYPTNANTTLHTYITAHSNTSQKYFYNNIATSKREAIANMQICNAIMQQYTIAQEEQNDICLSILNNYVVMNRE